PGVRYRNERALRVEKRVRQNDSRVAAGRERGAESNGYDSLFHGTGNLVWLRLVPEIREWFIAQAGGQSVAPCRWTSQRSGQPGSDWLRVFLAECARPRAQRRWRMIRSTSMSVNAPVHQKWQSQSAVNTGMSSRPCFSRP